MSYQVLARKYRPCHFSDMVGQSAVLRILTQALEQNRIHHAYLLTGSRGVGKTSLARLIAKCLNCALGVSATPCGTCTACLSIAQGHFLDVIERDAASHTKVEETRELLDHVQYAPTIGRYKIYLMDEVHMLSTHSFNALLKTLEEPPPHTIFILATTEPKRLPVTIVSRCLQFHLRNLSVEQIVVLLEKVLAQEKIAHEPEALHQLALAAEGSMRDALGLLDQAILYGKDIICSPDVTVLLGQVRDSDQYALINALISGDAAALMNLIEQMSEEGVDFDQALKALLSRLHQITVCQLLPEEHSLAPREIANMAQQLSPETVQLYYQIALIGRRDFSLAVTPKLGFEMTLLRMLAFHPVETPITPQLKTSEHNISNRNLLGQPTSDETLQKTQFRKNSTAYKDCKPESNASIDSKAKSIDLDWPDLVKALPLTGITQSLAIYSTLEAYDGSKISLSLDPSQAALRHPRQEALLAQILSQHIGKPIQLEMKLRSSTGIAQTQLESQPLRKTPVRVTQTDLENSVLSKPVICSRKDPKDTLIQELIERFDATIQPDSISLKKEDTSHE